jgi:DNA-damage-inducible protein D
MNREAIIRLKKAFDAILQIFPDSRTGLWYARDIMKAMGYDRWENFSNVLKRASAACQNSGVEVENHFRDVTKMVPRQSMSLD